VSRVQAWDNLMSARGRRSAGGVRTSPSVPICIDGFGALDGSMGSDTCHIHKEQLLSSPRQRRWDTASQDKTRRRLRGHLLSFSPSHLWKAFQTRERPRRERTRKWHFSSTAGDQEGAILGPNGPGQLSKSRWKMYDAQSTMRNAIIYLRFTPHPPTAPEATNERLDKRTNGRVKKLQEVDAAGLLLPRRYRRPQGKEMAPISLVRNRACGNNPSPCWAGLGWAGLASFA
jgi:hypothetical protein